MVVLDLEKLSEALTFRLTGLATSDDLAFLFSSLPPPPLPATISCRKLPLSTLFIGFLLRVRSGTDLQYLSVMFSSVTRAGGAKGWRG